MDVFGRETARPTEADAPVLVLVPFDHGTWGEAQFAADFGGDGDLAL